MTLLWLSSRQRIIQISIHTQPRYNRTANGPTDEEGPPHKEDASSSERDGSFNFLGLPSELRDAIYDYALSSPDSYCRAESVQNKYIMRRRGRPVSSTTATPSLFAVSRQISHEAFNWLYRSTTFLVNLDKDFNIMDTCSSKNCVPPENHCAMPLGWDVTRIVNLELHVDLETLLTTENAEYAGLGLDFSSLARMAALSRLRVVVLGWLDKSLQKALNEGFSFEGILATRLSEVGEKKLAALLVELLEKVPNCADRKVDVVFGHTDEASLKIPELLNDKQGVVQSEGRVVNKLSYFTIAAAWTGFRC
ncbi:hypothetical protein DM02DRAFT_728012 [Periconia macrospinosa]|uniref:F-box domain-containing protein n=1 Tax=Periconia macrospinosa TaxID=97972 RepID=A0A2V1DTN3_9PLEO|nr:hypothetical protein DM02DRAFT_728012 [Periconia macrospinosa]